MKVAELLKSLKNYTLYGDERRLGVEVTGLSADSRSCRFGELFICFKGQKVDSHEYAEDVIEKGAVAVVVERKLDIGGLQILVEDARLAMSLIATAFYGSPSERMNCRSSLIAFSIKTSPSSIASIQSFSTMQFFRVTSIRSFSASAALIAERCVLQSF